MHSITAAPSVEVSSELLAQIEKWYDQSQIWTIWEAIQDVGPLVGWVGPTAAVWAGRLAGHLGSQRLAEVIVRRAQRRYPRHAQLAAYVAYDLLRRRGPLASWEWLREFGPPPEDATADERLTLWSVQLEVACAFRDFERAEKALERAQADGSNDPWVCVLEARLFELQDAYEEALERAYAALELEPLFRPALQQAAHLLQIRDRREAALALLEDAVQRTTAGALELQRAALLAELNRFEPSLRAYDRFLELSPLADRHYRQWVDRQRLTMACRAGELDRARVLVEILKDPVYADLRERLKAEDPPCIRKVLSVDFVRQHHLTCVPATLSALSRYWDRPAEHLELAETICYDGTSAHSERSWAEGRGYRVREFTVTWEAAVALIDRGLPFTLTTTEVLSAHAQAVIGYEELRRTLIIRDPFVYQLREAVIPQFLERYAAHGPRGMVMVPAEEVGRLEGLALPDADEYDRLWAVMGALDRHARGEAVRGVDRMQSANPNHRLTKVAAWALARYDNNTPVVLEQVEGLLASYPKDGSLQATRLDCLRVLYDRKTRMEALEAQAAIGSPEPLFLAWLATELKADPREQGRAKRFLRAALKSYPAEADVLTYYAAFLYDAGDRDGATEVTRLAACLGDRREHYSATYFQAARGVRRTEEALAFLRRRFLRLSGQSGQPACTLCEALTELDRVEEAKETLEEAERRKPDDADLLLYAAQWLAWHGFMRQAEDCLDRARGRTHRARWLRSAVVLEERSGDRAGKLAAWREVAELEPLAIDAHRGLAWALAESEGHEAATTYLEGVCVRFPQHCGLLGLQVELQHGQGLDAMEPALRRLLEANPVDAWALRELAMRLAEAGRMEEALAMVERAIEVDPDSSYGYSIRGNCLLSAGQTERAREEFGRAIQFSVENGYALQALVNTAITPATRTEALDLIQSELVRQVVFDKALFAFQDAARGVLAPEPVLSRLQDALSARPELWSAWAAVVIQLRDMNLLEEALQRAETACERFPYVPRLWVELAEVHRVRLEIPEARAALEHALELNPGYSGAAIQLAEICQHTGELARARAVLERALVHGPLIATHHGALADVLWQQGEREAAVEALQTALRLEPDYPWAWRMLQTWSAELNREELPVRVARDLTERRPAETSSWLQLADVLAQQSQYDEALEAVDRALRLNARDAEAYELKARIYTAMDRFEEALESCRPEALQPRPTLLTAREAWIEDSRGRRKVAIERMREVVEADPTFYAGWEFLADRLTEAGSYQAAADAADQMAQLAPQKPVPLGYAGDLRLCSGDREGALERFERAFRLDPDYLYAGAQLMHLYLEDGRLVEAGEVLRRLKPHWEDVNVRAYAVALDAKEGRWDEAKRGFTELCQEPTDGDWSLRYAAGVLAGVGKGSWVNRTLTETVRGDRINPHAAVLWVERCLARRRYRLSRDLRRLVGKSNLAEPVLMAVAGGLGEGWAAAAHLEGPFLRWLLHARFRRVWKRYREEFTRSDALWGQVSYTLTAMRRYRQAVDWLRDWPERKQVEPWVLHNLAMSLILLKEPGEALKVLRHAVNLRMDADIYSRLAMLTAVETALTGALQEGQSWLDSVPGHDETSMNRALRLMTRALIEAGEPLGSRRQILRRVRKTVRSAFEEYRPVRYPPIVRQAYWRVLDRIRRDLRAPSLRIWGWLHYR